jgi:hypothetical protein
VGVYLDGNDLFKKKAVVRAYQVYSPNQLTNFLGQKKTMEQRSPFIFFYDYYLMCSYFYEFVQIER